ncbi:Ion-translocating oxidoreductase complex subunit C [Stutzerimonas stutzeri]
MSVMSKSDAGVARTSHADATKVWDIPGGIHPAEHKTQSNRTPIQPAPLPKRLIVPLAQHLGAPAEACVQLGERVLKGQKIADAAGLISAPVHAPTSGVVSFIGPQPYPHVSGLPGTAIVIDSDGLEQWTELHPQPHYRSVEPAALLEIIRQAGISGLGGAGFPAAVKLGARTTQKIHTLIINGTECEPYITADDLLMREQAEQLVAGIEILAYLVEPEAILIGIEDNKPEAIAAVRAAVGERPFTIKVFPTKYPSGGEKQLIQILTGEEVPSGGLPADIGMLCQNVGTCVAIHDAVLLGKPLISRITTLTGEALARPMNVEALIGTPVRELLEFAGLNPARLDRLLMGGPMMGFTLPSLDVPLIKTTNCLLAVTAAELPPPHRRCHAFVVANVPKPVPPACCHSSCTSSHSATSMRSCARTTCSTASNAAPAPTSAHRAFPWCSTTGRPRRKSANWNSSSRRPNTPSSASSCVRNACAARRSTKKQSARPAPRKPHAPRQRRRRPPERRHRTMLSPARAAR